MAMAFKVALEKAQLNPKDIDYINSHGNGILDYDIGETEAIKKVFGELAYQIPISSIKPVTGQSLSPTGIYQVITSLLVMRNGIIPPTINHKNPAPECDLNYVPNHYIRKGCKHRFDECPWVWGRHTVLVVGKLDKN